jgi:branched-chain amino acid transport system permease protein
MNWHEVLIQQTVNGVTRGAVFALIALGYTMVYGIIGLINFAHGDVFMLGLFISLSYLTLLGMATSLHGWQLVTVLPLVFLATMLTHRDVNAVIDVAYRPLPPRLPAPPSSAIGVSFMRRPPTLIWKAPRPSLSRRVPVSGHPARVVRRTAPLHHHQGSPRPRGTIH